MLDDSSIKKFIRIMKHKHTLGLFFLFLIGLVFFLGYVTSTIINRNKYEDFLNGFRNIRENSSKYSFVNPLIGSITSPATDVGLFVDIKNEIDSYLKQEEKKGDLFEHSFYFRDLNSGLWFGSNESSTFFPASLFKLPIAIAAYKQMENDHSFKSRAFLYTEELAKRNQDIQLNAASTLTVGRMYSVEELVKTMLINSDNGAKDLLLSSIDMNYFEDLLKTVSAVDFDTEKKYDLSSRKYALFLRVLYGSSYLDEEHSELIMSLLTMSDYKDALVGGIPEDIKVAHKFGTYQFEDDVKGVKQVSRQLHDCGVVYHPQKPYIICFMTKGKDLETLQTIITHVSKLVYQYQDKED